MMQWQVSSACAAWATHTVILKFLLYLMGIPAAVPFLETVAYAGYPFVLVCLSAFVGAAAGVPSGPAQSACCRRTVRPDLSAASPLFMVPAFRPCELQA